MFDLQSSSKNVSVLYERELLKHTQKSQEPKSTGELAIAPSNGPNVYVDKMKALVESLLADEHYNLCV